MTMTIMYCHLNYSIVILTMLNEKYALQSKVSEINSLADKIYDFIIEVSSDLEDGLSDLNDELSDEGSVLAYK